MFVVLSEKCFMMSSNKDSIQTTEFSFLNKPSEIFFLQLIPIYILISFEVVKIKCV